MSRSFVVHLAVEDPPNIRAGFPPDVMAKDFRFCPYHAHVEVAGQPSEMGGDTWCVPGLMGIAGKPADLGW